MTLLFTAALTLSQLTTPQLCALTRQLSAADQRTLTADELNLEHYAWAEVDIRDVLAECEREWEWVK